MRQYPALVAGDAGAGSKHLRVVRGGSYFNDRTNLRCAYRNRNHIGNRNNNLGFRVVVVSTLFSRPAMPGGASRPFQAEAKNGGARSWPRPDAYGPGTQQRPRLLGAISEAGPHFCGSLTN